MSNLEGCTCSGVYGRDGRCGVHAPHTPAPLGAEEFKGSDGKPLDLGPLSAANVDQQFCSDWLKDEMRGLFATIDARDREIERLNASALNFHAEISAQMSRAEAAEAELVKVQNHARGSDQDYERACDERDQALRERDEARALAAYLESGDRQKDLETFQKLSREVGDELAKTLALAARYREALEECRDANRGDLIKRPPFFQRIEKVTTEALATPTPSLDAVKAKHFREAADTLRVVPCDDSNHSGCLTCRCIGVLRVEAARLSGERGRRGE